MQQKGFNFKIYCMHIKHFEKILTETSYSNPIYNAHEFPA